MGLINGILLLPLFLDSHGLFTRKDDFLTVLRRPVRLGEATVGGQRGVMEHPGGGDVFFFGWLGNIFSRC